MSREKSVLTRLPTGPRHTRSGSLVSGGQDVSGASLLAHGLCQTALADTRTQDLTAKPSRPRTKPRGTPAPSRPRLSRTAKFVSQERIVSLALTRADYPGHPKDHGSCHCGAVTLALKSKPLETLDPTVDAERIVDCNCSICVRNAYLWVYPRVDQSAVSGREHLSYRVFNSGFNRKAFCKHCGVNMWNEANELTGKPLCMGQPHRPFITHVSVSDACCLSRKGV